MFYTDKYKRNWAKLFVYDPESPTFLRWIVPRKGRSGLPVKRINNGVAGNKTPDNSLTVNVEGKTYCIKYIVL